MDSLKVDRNIFPESISDISIVHEDSEFQSLANKGDKTVDYQIKINGQNSIHNINSSDFALDKAERLQYLQTQNISSFHVPAVHLLDEDSVPHPQKIQYKDKVTGFDTMKDKLNDEQLLKAFKIIDITKDDAITREDIMFILDYLKEDYTLEEVKQMIDMVSTDKVHVYFQNFKDIAKGQIMPLAAFKMPTPVAKSKSQIFNNLHTSDLLTEDPSKIIPQLKDGTLSFQKYEELKKNTKGDRDEKQQKFQAQMKKRQGDKASFLNCVLPIKSQEEYKKRRQVFDEILVIVNRQLFKKFANISFEKKLHLNQIASLLQIDIKSAKVLYPKCEQKQDTGKDAPTSVLVLMEVITFSKLKTIDKLKLSFEAINSQQTITIVQIEHLFQLLKGKDFSIGKKIKAIFTGHQFDTNSPIKKIDALEILREYLNVLLI